jgi:hypothetical protein
MTTLVYVGPNAKLVSGVSGAGYRIYRRRRNVYARWGPIEVEGAGLGRRIYWIGYGQTQEWQFPSEPEAADFVRKKIEQRMKGYAGRHYKPLPAGVRIYD